MIGKRLAHYQIQAQLGAGGMGEVFRAFDSKLERQVALKILPPQMAQDPDRRQRFEREAKAVAALRHPHIVTIYSVEEAAGFTFLTMELLEGCTLAEMTPPGGLPLSRFLEIALPIADAVGHAHARGITHRDLKPANVMLEHGRHVKVLDFGLAKMMAPASEADAATVGGTNLTGEGRVLGTASYMAPEQAEGKPTDARSDVFALGVVFYEMVTGERPFKGTNEITTLTSILRDTPPAVTELKPDLPRHLGRVIKRCLEKDPLRRYESARALALELETLREELQAGAPPETHSPSRPGGLPAAAVPASAGVSQPSTPPPAPPSGEAVAPGAPSSAGWTPASHPPYSSPPASRRSRRWGIVAGSLVGLAAVVTALLWATSREERAPGIPQPPAVAVASSAASRATIVVFPFENLGPAEDAYFAAGVADEITNRLAHVQGLAVLSRTTATQYDRKGKTMQQVVADLGVQYVLDGTVRWQRLPGGKSRVRVSPQLIRAADDTQMWTSSYDHAMEEIFRVQSDIATQVVGKLGVALLGSERAALEEAPTANMEAYQAYLRGKEDMDRFILEETSWRTCIQMFERAVSLDPVFLQAYAQLSKAYSGLCHFKWERTEEVLAKAKAAADRAIELDPQSPWGHMALGYYYYWGRKEYDRAEAEIATADRLLPNQVDFLLARAFILRRRGAFESAAQLLEQAEKLDPRNVELFYTTGETQLLLRRLSAANAAFDRALQLAPNGTSAYLGKARTALLAGDGEHAQAILAGARVASEPGFLLDCASIYFNARQFDRALEWGAKLPDFHEAQFSVVCRPLFMGLVYDAMDQSERARPELEAACKLLEAHLRVDPDDANTTSALALATAALGKKSDAERDAARALELYPAKQDQWIRQHRLFDQVRVHILTGESAAALDALEKFLASDTDRVSVPFLRLSPYFDPLRANPRFQQLLARTS